MNICLWFSGIDCRSVWLSRQKCIGGKNHRINQGNLRRWRSMSYKIAKLVVSSFSEKKQKPNLHKRSLTFLTSYATDIHTRKLLINFSFQSEPSGIISKAYILNFMSIQSLKLWVKPWKKESYKITSFYIQSY